MLERNKRVQGGKKPRPSYINLHSSLFLKIFYYICHNIVNDRTH